MSKGNDPDPESGSGNRSRKPEPNPNPYLWLMDIQEAQKHADSDRAPNPDPQHWFLENESHSVCCRFKFFRFLYVTIFMETRIRSWIYLTFPVYFLGWVESFPAISILKSLKINTGRTQTHVSSQQIHTDMLHAVRKLDVCMWPNWKIKHSWSLEF